jgi:hypothetical protein
VGRQAPDSKNVHRTAGRGLVARRWPSHLSEWLGGTRCEDTQSAEIASPGTCWLKLHSFYLWSLHLKKPHTLILCAEPLEKRYELRMRFSCSLTFEVSAGGNGMTLGPGYRKCTPYLWPGPSGMPLALRLTEGLGRARRRKRCEYAASGTRSSPKVPASAPKD